MFLKVLFSLDLIQIILHIFKIYIENIVMNAFERLPTLI
jgi:hypothetical protein